ncbi:MAG: sigma-54 dependent transcriptional regulator [Desulfomicrobium sp.]|jgi:two-component system response regulator AtoC|nr:sigma-54 dependent transcriptional regulator [Desulfomicrobium sp.]
MALKNLRKKQTGKNLPPVHARSTAEMLDLGTEDGLGKFIIQSQSMRELYRLATQVAGADATILIYGESGTGKELFARLVHQLSGRRHKPFVPVNCGVLKGELFADKFFGHEIGAFTGAQRQRKGSFELAANGTLFLDEVGEVPLHNQVDFLRVLEEKTFRRLGGEKILPFEARIVAATNRLLQDMVLGGEFRADLYYRLNVVPVTLPPLRERTDDIPVLAQYFLGIYGHRYHKPEVTMTSATLELLCDYSWPGNVRELRNLIERLVLLSTDLTIDPSHLPLEMRLTSHLSSIPSTDQSVMTLEAAVRQAEVAAIIRAWQEAGGSKAKLAEILRISPRSLRYKLAEYELKLKA